MMVECLFFGGCFIVAALRKLQANDVLPNFFFSFCLYMCALLECNIAAVIDVSSNTDHY